MDAKRLTSELEKRLGRDSHDIELLCSELGRAIAESVAEGDAVIVPAFGTFEAKKRSERISQHPATGKKMLLPPKLSMVFKPSATLKQKIRK